ncbi:hypothetical protein BG004_003741 [Podila humilis]|nr:hypothetical protein BG004_003741 [Podila humilis]
MSNSAQSPPGNTSTNLLDCDAVLKLLQDLLPNRAPTTATTSTSTSAAEDELASTPHPTTVILASEYESLAALSHAIMTAVGFRLVGLGEDDTLENERKTMDDITKANALPNRWNASSESYSFRYTHPNSQLNYLIKCIRIAHKFVIHGTTIETSKICSLELQAKDFTSPSYFPFSSSTDTERDPLWNGFISRSRINDLISQYKINIIQQLIPGLSKPGYQEEAVPAPSASSSSQSTTNSGADSRTSSGRGRGGHDDYYPDNDPLRMPGGVGGVPRPGFIPRPPIFGDPFSAEDPAYYGGGGGMGIGGSHNPFNIGRDDLDPFGGRLGGAGGFGGGIGGSSGGGMIVGPNHPMFRRPPSGGNSGGGGIYGGPQPLPRGSVPPGARFDPIGPFGSGHGSAGNAPGAGTAHQDPHRGQGQGQGQGQGRGSGRGVPFSGEPDNDEAPPPGYMDMFM